VKVPEKVWEASVQSQVRFNRMPEMVPEEVLEKVWEALVQSQARFNRTCGHFTHGNPAEVFPAHGFAARFRKICKNKTLAGGVTTEVLQNHHFSRRNPSFSR